MTPGRSRGVPNRGGERLSSRDGDGTAGYVLSGPLRWIERDGSRAALLVAEANAPGRRLIGQTLTLDLRSTSVRTADRNGDGERSPTDLLPGERVTIKARLPARTVAPTLVTPHRLIADGP